MFYCDSCGDDRDWPTDQFFQSYGKCECCHASDVCNDVPSKFLSPPKTVPGEAEAIESIKRAAEEAP